ncbi:hypothetical protein Chor_006310 [Crotalus horridus]
MSMVPEQDSGSLRIIISVLSFPFMKSSGPKKVHLSKNYFLTNRARERSNTFINLREVLNRFKLPPGEYIIVPSTFEPNKNGDFCLRVFSEKKADSQYVRHSLIYLLCLLVIDDEIEANIEEKELTEDEIEPNFKKLFKQLAGEDAEISAFELCNILKKILAKRQDIKSDGFSSSREKWGQQNYGWSLKQNEEDDLVSLTKQTDGSGKLGLKEFHILWTKIQKYQQIYRDMDVDRSGTMNSYEMRKALEQAGFKLDCQLHQVIVARFADEQLIIDFDNFVRCLIRLETLFMVVLYYHMKKQCAKWRKVLLGINLEHFKKGLIIHLVLMVKLLKKRVLKKNPKQLPNNLNILAVTVYVTL